MDLRYDSIRFFNSTNFIVDVCNSEGILYAQNIYSLILKERKIYLPFLSHNNLLKNTKWI